MANSIDEKPEEEQDVIVFCPEYCPEQYTIATYKNGEYIGQASGDEITEHVVEWVPLSQIEEEFFT